MNTPYLLGSSAPPPPPPAAAPNRYQAEDDKFVLKDLLGMVRDQLPWVLGIALLIVAVATAYAFLATPKYVADALLQVEAPSQNTIGVGRAGEQAQQAGQKTPTDAEIELLKSRSVLAPVVEKFKLDVSVSPHVFPLLGNLAHKLATPGHPGRPWFWLKSYAWGGEQLSVDTIEVPASLDGAKLTLRAQGEGKYQLLTEDGRLLLEGVAGTAAEANGVTLKVGQLVARPGTEFTVVRYSPLSAIRNLAQGLQVVERSKDTGVVTVSFESTNPDKATAITNEVVASFLAQHIAHRQEEATKMLQFLQSELPRFRDELDHAEAALSKEQTHSGSMAPTAEAQTYLQGGLDYERQIATLNLQRTQLLQRFTPQHPQVQALDAQLAQLNAQKAHFESKFNALPTAERQSVALQRNAKVAEEIYIALVNKIQELSVNRAGMVGNVHVVDQALRPTGPVSPNRPVIIGAAVVLGVIAGILFAFVRRTFFTGVEDPEFIERSLNLPMFGSVSYSPEQARIDDMHKAGKLPAPAAADSTPPAPGSAARRVPVKTDNRPVLARNNPHDMSVEGLRSFRTALQFSMVDAPNKIVTLTGPAPGIGKSFLTVNLGVLLAEAGKRVLIIDADMRRGKLAEHFGRKNENGLAEYLTGQIDIEQAVNETKVDRLFFIGSGAHPPNPSELLMSPRLRELLEQCDQEFDIVIVDTPPVLAVTDASIIAHLTGTTVLVLRSGAHSEREIEETLKKLHRAGARIMGGVFNAVPVRNHAGGRYGRGYEYAYQYRYEPDMK